MKIKIPIKKYVMDESLSWEERYRKLEAHHKIETEFLISTIEGLENLAEMWEKRNTFLLTSLAEGK